MSTILRKLPYANPDSSGLDPITVSDTEMAIFATASVLHWWRADSGFDETGWACRKTGAQLVAAASGLPTVQTISAYGDKASLLFSGTTPMFDGGAQLLPEGDFTVVHVGRGGPSSDSMVWGSGGSSTQRTAFQQLTDGRMTLGVRPSGGGSSISTAATTGYLRPYSSGPTLATNSRAIADGTQQSRYNAGAFSSVVATGAVGEGLINRELRVGAAGSANSLPITGGDLAEFIVLNVPLHKTENVNTRTLIENYLMLRYGIVG